MTAQEYEVNLETLEEMCSEIEESAYLIDSGMNVIWFNKIFSKNMLAYPGYTSENLKNPSELIDYCKEQLLENFGPESIISRIFGNGRLTKTIQQKNNASIKKTYIPINDGQKVGYVLVIAETITDTAKLFEAVSKNFIESIKNPVFVTDHNQEFVTSNTLFDKAFSKNDVLRKFILHSISKSSYQKELRSLLSMKYRLKVQEIRHKKLVVGFIYELEILSRVRNIVK